MLLALLCCMLWGSAFPCIKIGYRYFSILSEDTGAQILFAGCRFMLAGILVILSGSIRAGKILVPGKEAWKKAGILCLFQTVLQYLFFYIGLAHTTGVKASIIGASNVFASIIIASIFMGKEKLTREKIAGCITGFAGVVIINLGDGSKIGHLSWQGEGFILLSAIAYAVSTVLIKQYSQTEDTVLLSGYQFFMGGIAMILVGFGMGGRLTQVQAGGMLLLFYLAFVSAMAYTLWGILLSCNPVSKVAVFGFMTPLCGVLLSGLLLSERSLVFGVQTGVALACVCAGIYIVNAGWHEKEAGQDSDI